LKRQRRFLGGIWFGLSFCYAIILIILYNCPESVGDFLGNLGGDGENKNFEREDGKVIRWALRVIIAVVMIMSSVSFGGTYSGGTGEPNNPYQIATGADLLTLGANTVDYGKCFILTADIDMQGQVFTTAIIAPDTSSNSGFQGTVFTGIFDGNGHKVTHFTINGGTGSTLGLFGYIGSSGSVKNLDLENCSVSGRYYVGSLVGINYGIISNCHSAGTVYGSSGSDGIGGLAGSNHGTINKCSSTGTVSGSTTSIGGLAGVNNGSNITSCYSTSTVSGALEVGGLVGYNLHGTISNCYAAGSVNGSNTVGGLVGWNVLYGSIICCYSVGAVSGTVRVGGLVGDELEYASVLVSYWDTQTSQLTSSAGGTGKTTTEMKTLSTFTSNWMGGWDFTNETANGTNDYWRMCADGVGYPRLSWEFVKGGDFSCPDGVAMDDVVRLSQDWLTTYSQACYGADANGDSKVTFADFVILAANWTKN
jgi:hypothetical protein